MKISKDFQSSYQTILFRYFIVYHICNHVIETNECQLPDVLERLKLSNKFMLWSKVCLDSYVEYSFWESHLSGFAHLGICPEFKLNNIGHFTYPRNGDVLSVSDTIEHLKLEMYHIEKIIPKKLFKAFTILLEFTDEN